MSEPRLAEPAVDATPLADPGQPVAAGSLLDQLYDPQRPEIAVAGAFAGGLLFAMLLRRLRS